MLASVASMIDQFNMPNIRLMLDMGFEVHTACNFEKGSTCDQRRIREFQKQLDEMHVIWHQWDCPRSIGSPAKCGRAFIQLWKLTGQHHFEWMHCHSPVGGALARLAAHYRKIKVIYTAHGFHFYKGAPLKNWLFYYPVEKLLAYWTDVLITINREDFWFAKRNLKAGQIRWNPGVGINIRQFKNHQPQRTKEEFRKKYRLPENAKILLSVGELSRRKNHALVLSVLPWVNKGVYYFICGQGELRKPLLAMTQKLGITERIRLLGYVEDICGIYKNADLFVFPSLQEGLPAALVEAMACGLPCLVSDIRGNRELVRQKSGRFQSNSRQSFFKRLTALLDDPELMKENLRQGQIQAEKYDRKRVEAKIRKIYQEIGNVES